MEKYNRGFIYFICLVSAMGGLLFGYDWVVIGGAKPFYEQYFEIANSPVMQGWAMSVALLGCLIGATLAGFLADKYGRKKMLIAAAVIFLVSAYFTGASSSFALFLVARFFGGIGIGVASDISPMYIAEVAPTSVRGKLVSLNQLAIVLGILAAQISNWQIADPIPAGFTGLQIMESWNGQMGWRWMFWGAAFPAALFFILALIIPESPRWSALNGQGEKAGKILKRIGGAAYAEAELSAIQEGVIHSEEEQGSFKILFSKGYRPVLLLGVVLAFFQQWSGTNVIFNYAQEIFQAAGFTLSDVLFNIVVTGIANLIFTFVAIYTVDKLGRRALMLIGAGGLCGIYLIMGTCYFFHVSGWFMVLLVVMAIACYAMSLGPITWVILSEIFPNRVRGIAMAVSTFSLWVGCFTLTYSFPLLNTWMGTSGTFWLYGIICALGYFFVFKRLPETKGKSLEELEKDLIKK